MNWVFVVEILYLLIVIAVCVHIIFQTDSAVKTLAYLLIAVFIPVFGMLFYFSFGLNYRKKELYSKKLIANDELWQKVKTDLNNYSAKTYYSIDAEDRPSEHLTRYLTNEMSPLTSGNSASLLVNGEEKFPAVIKALEEARDHIHIEYYIYENDEIGQRIEEILVRKAKEGVTVRFIYDDFGSSEIRKSLAKRLSQSGVEVYPFYKIKFIVFANRLNYRNHRKIIVIDGKKGFVGGINVSDRYINKPNSGSKIFWRDTHVMLEGPAVQYLQYLFLCDWNFCSGQQIEITREYFPNRLQETESGGQLIQFAAGGPDSVHPTILYSLLFAIYQAEEELLITTPYFIPEQSIIDAIIVAAMGGVSVRLLVPEKSDSKLVGLAAASYYDALLAAGVQIFFYRKGFVHAKTLVADKKLSVIGTANMDFRSFDLNFEVNAMIYDVDFGQSLATVFESDIKQSVLIEETKWSKRSVFRKFAEKVARLVSPLL